MTGDGNACHSMGRRNVKSFIKGNDFNYFTAILSHIRFIMLSITVYDGLVLVIFTLVTFVFDSVLLIFLYSVYTFVLLYDSIKIV